MSAAIRKPAITPGGPLGRFVVGLILGAVRATPRRLRESFIGAIASIAWLLGVRRRVALENLRAALPEKTEAERRQIARGVYQNLAAAALESVTSDLLTDDELARLVRIDDWKGLDAVLEARKPVLIASAHFGSWELFAEVMARRGYVFSAVVRPLAGAFNEWVVKNRQRSGVELILQRGALFRMLAALEQGRAVVQLIDQALPSKEAVFVPFFGRLASATPAISATALRSGAPVYVVLAVREAGGLRMVVEGPIPLPDLPDRTAVMQAHTAALTAVIERWVRQFPDQWLWLHRRWKVPPPAQLVAGRP